MEVVSRSRLSNSVPLEFMSTVQRVMNEAASRGLNGAPCTSGKNGNMLFFASGVSKW